MARNGAADRYRPMIQSAAKAYGYDPGVLMQVARLESSFNPNVVNDWDSNAKAGIPSKGMFQFIEPTFNAYAKQARKANPAAWRGVQANWLNPQAQALAASWAMANGKGSAWATFDEAKRLAGGVQRQPMFKGAASIAAAPSGSAGFDTKQRAALNMMFGDNPRMLRLVNMVGERASAAPASVEPAGASGDGFKLGKIIGTPYSGTHTIGNWQSDNALDVALKPGTPIYAQADGVITNPGTVGSGPGNGSGRFDGYKATLRSKGNAYWYGHLQKLLVKEGQRVRRGQLIGYSGSANGVGHLHFGQQHGKPRYG